MSNNNFLENKQLHPTTTISEIKCALSQSVQRLFQAFIHLTNRSDIRYIPETHTWVFVLYT